MCFFIRLAHICRRLDNFVPRFGKNGLTGCQEKENLTKLQHIILGASMKTKICVALITLILGLNTLFATDGESFLGAYLLSYPQSVGEAFLAPKDWHTEDWLAAGGAVIAVGSLYFADTAIKNKIQNHRKDWLELPMEVGSEISEFKYLYPAVALTIGAGYLAGSDKTMDTGLLCLKSMILSSVSTQALKIATQRPQPGMEIGAGFWTAPSFSLSNDSFPSGHSAIIWSVVPVLAAQYPDQKWVAPTVYGLASLSSVSRLYLDEHWAADVAAGALIGYLCGKLTLKNTPRLHLTPAQNMNGLTLSVDF